MFFKQECEDLTTKIRPNFSEKNKLLVGNITWPLLASKVIKKNKRKERKIKINAEERCQMNSCSDSSTIPTKTSTFSRKNYENTKKSTK